LGYSITRRTGERLQPRREQLRRLWRRQKGERSDDHDNQYAKERGARTVEAYPIEPGGDLERFDGFTGIASAFRKAGFMEVYRINEKQVVMRKEVAQTSAL
jgi:hypothetical protein